MAGARQPGGRERFYGGSGMLSLADLDQVTIRVTDLCMPLAVVVYPVRRSAPINAYKDQLEFRGYAVALSQASRTAWISAGVSAAG